MYPKRKILALIILGMFICKLNAQNRRSASNTTTKSRPAQKATTKEVEKPIEIKPEEVKKPKKYTSDISNWGIQIELGVLPVKSINTQTLNCYQGSLGLNYKLFSKFYMGIFGQTLMYHQNIDVASIDYKIIDLSSVEYNSVGLRLLFKLPMGKFSFQPQVDGSYNLFVAKAIDYEQDNKAFLDYQYLSICPKLNFGFNLTESTCISLFGGYNMQINAIKGKTIEEFNPSNYTGGLNLTVQIPN